MSGDNSWMHVVCQLPSENEIVDVRQIYGTVWEGYHLVNGKWIPYGGDKLSNVDMVEAWKPSDSVVVEELTRVPK